MIHRQKALQEEESRAWYERKIRMSSKREKSNKRSLHNLPAKNIVTNHERYC